LPFELAWLLSLLAFVRLRRPSLLVAATLSLGLGFYTHPASVLLMPAYVALTLLTVREVYPSVTAQFLAVLGFAIPLLVLVPWFGRHHDVFRFTLGDWGLHALANPRDGLRYSVFNWTRIADR